MRFPLITGHSGCEGTPRDSMASVDQVCASSAECVEVDVRRDGGRTLRISHDKMTDAQYSSFATLSTVFERIKDTQLMINCDIKEAEIVYDVLDMAAKFNFCRDRLIFSGSVSPEQLARDEYIRNNATIYLNVEEILKFFAINSLIEKDAAEQLPRLFNHPWEYVRETLMGDNAASYAQGAVKLCKALGADALNLPKRCLTREFAMLMEKNGLPFSVWTVNEPEDIRLCISLGARNVTTLALTRALSIRKEQLGF